MLKIICTYPESTGLEDHLQIIKSEIADFKPARIAIDSLSALARGVSNNAFRQFVIGVTGYAKQEEITGFLPIQQTNLWVRIRLPTPIFPQLLTRF